MTLIDFDPEAIRTLATILRDGDLTEIELVDGERRIRLVRTQSAVPIVAAAAAPQPAPIAVSAAPSAPPPHDDGIPAGAIPSPMVGIAYLAPDPNSSPFVTQGQTVAAGQTVLLIEAMKTFNQIKAPRAGTVTRILVTGGQPVEYGQPLLVIE
ncbi:MAG: acetyl-CoA carboxylase biotin carboxyl carrier protein [Acetobacteraceae bacterium]